MARGKKGFFRKAFDRFKTVFASERKVTNELNDTLASAEETISRRNDIVDQLPVGSDDYGTDFVKSYRKAIAKIKKIKSKVTRIARLKSLKQSTIEKVNDLTGDAQNDEELVVNTIFTEIENFGSSERYRNIVNYSEKVGGTESDLIKSTLRKGLEKGGVSPENVNLDQINSLVSGLNEKGIDIGVGEIVNILDEL